MCPESAIGQAEVFEDEGLATGREQGGCRAFLLTEACQAQAN
jgi:hypothetical protein